MIIRVCRNATFLGLIQFIWCNGDSKNIRLIRVIVVYINGVEKETHRSCLIMAGENLSFGVPAMRISYNHLVGIPDR
jgi:hypothetical protein